MCRDTRVFSPFMSNGIQYVKETTFEGYDMDTGTANGIHSRILKLSDLMSRTAKGNRDDILIFEATAKQIEMATGMQAYGGKDGAAFAKCCTFTTADVIELSSPDEARDIATDNSLKIWVGDTLYLVNATKYTTATRLFTVHHYNRDGAEQWYFSHSGLRVSNVCDALYCTRRLASNTKTYKARYDGCANVAEYFVIQ